MPASCELYLRVIIQTTEKCMKELKFWGRLFKGWIALSTREIAIQWISINKTNYAIHWIVIYPAVNSVIHPSDNRALLI